MQVNSNSDLIVVPLLTIFSNDEEILSRFH
jgi:hypothetical protein